MTMMTEPYTLQTIATKHLEELPTFASAENFFEIYPLLRESRANDEHRGEREILESGGYRRFSMTDGGTHVSSDNFSSNTTVTISPLDIALFLVMCSCLLPCL